MPALPDLPKQNKQAEAEFGLYFRRWVKSYAHELRSCSFELKHTHGAGSLPFNEVKGEQIAFASMIAGDGVLIRVIGMGGEPDYVWMRHAPAYVVIRYPSCFCVIAMKLFVVERNTSDRKSLTEERARELSTWCVAVP